jgi:hypothetical protein
VVAASDTIAERSEIVHDSSESLFGSLWHARERRE